MAYRMFSIFCFHALLALIPSTFRYSMVTRSFPVYEFIFILKESLRVRQNENERVNFFKKINFSITRVESV